MKILIAMWKDDDADMMVNLGDPDYKDFCTDVDSASASVGRLERLIARQKDEQYIPSAEKGEEE